MARRHETDVVVAGAGPVGLFTALCLAEQGLRVEIYERARDTSHHSFGLGLHPGSLALLDRLGLGARLASEGHRLRRLVFLEGGETRAEVDLGRLGGDHPHLLVLAQSRFEDALVAALGERGVAVRWAHRVAGFEAGADGVRVRVARLDRESSGYGVAEAEEVVVAEIETACSFLVGADGFRSLVREQLGVEFRDLGGHQNFSVFEYETADPLPEEVRLVFGPEGVGVFWPVEPGVGRWGFETGAATEAHPAGSRLRALLDERAPGLGPEPGAIRWSSGVHFERRMARPFGRDRVWLAGDAAHLTGPAGVQSMNVGLREGHELAGLLAGIVSRGQPLAGLSAYDEGRQEEWSRLLGERGGPEPRPDASAWVRSHAERLPACLPASGEDLDRLLDQLGLRLP